LHELSSGDDDKAAERVERWLETKVTSREAKAAKKKGNTEGKGRSYSRKLEKEGRKEGGF
jgi:hypothetical protein